MPLVSLSPEPILRFVGNDNLPLVGGKLFTYQAGTNTPYPTYTDSTGQFQHQNPIILNSRGEVAIAAGVSAGLWIPPNTAYQFVLQDSAGNQIWSLNNIQFLQTLVTNANVNAVLYPPTSWEQYAQVTRVSPQYPPSQGYIMNVWGWLNAAQIASCIAEDATLDMTDAIQAANDFLEGRSNSGQGGQPHPGGILFFPTGLYNITGNLRVGGNVLWKGASLQGTVLSWNDGSFTGTCVSLGPDESGFFPWSDHVFGASIESMRISLQPTNQHAVVIGTTGAHQGCHLYDMRVDGFNQIGISFGGVGGPAYTWIKDVELAGGTAEGLPTTRQGIFHSTGSILDIDTISIEGAGGHNVDIDVRVHNGSLTAKTLHFENSTTGVYFDTGGTNATSFINGINGNSSVTQLIWIPTNYLGSVTAIGINGLSGDPAHPIGIKNENTGEATLNTMVGIYSWSGVATSFQTGAYGYSLLHNHLSSHVRYGKSATQAIAQNTATLLTFPTKQDDAFSEWNGSRFTPVVPGRYRVTVTVAVASATWTAAAILRLYIMKSGSTYSTFEADDAVGTFTRQISHSDTVNLGVGDYIETQVFQGISASLNTDSSALTCYVAIDRMT